MSPSSKIFLPFPLSLFILYSKVWKQRNVLNFLMYFLLFARECILLFKNAEDTQPLLHGMTNYRFMTIFLEIILKFSSNVFRKLKERLALLKVAQKEEEETKRNDIIQAKVVCFCNFLFISSNFFLYQSIYNAIWRFLFISLMIKQEKDQFLMDTLESIAQRRAEKERENAKRFVCYHIICCITVNFILLNDVLLLSYCISLYHTVLNCIVLYYD